MIKLSDFSPLPEGGEQFPLEFIEKHQAIRLGAKGGTLHIGLVEVGDVILQDELRHFLGSAVEFHPVSSHEIAEYLGGIVSDSEHAESRPFDERTLLDRLANDAPIVNLVNTILLEGLRRMCSDIHVELLPRRVHVRYRIDGVLQSGRSLPREMFAGISSRIKIMANLDIIERRQPQDGRLSVSVGGQTVEFRISIVPLADGESIVLRVFQKDSDIKTLEGLGFSQDFTAKLRLASRSSHGLVLVTGPTGCGKTTTLNALIRELSRSDNKVITIEDPVENVLDWVNQIQTNEAIGLGFDTFLRRLLRQDPDVLMVGEIRDRTTADLTVRAALTGHLVFSTLHTNDALSAVPRLTDMGLEPFLLGTVLRGVVAQRLVRKVCPTCRTSAVPSREQQARLEQLGGRLEILFHGSGCQDCGGTGYRGRTVVAEVFLIDDQVEEIIATGGRRTHLEKYYRGLNAGFLSDDAMRLLRAGDTTLAEVERAVFAR